MPTETPTAPAAIWTPTVLSEYEIGRALSAIETVARMEKAVTEVGSRAADTAALEADLRRCLELSNEGCVKFWMRQSGPYIRWGFYRHDWALAALDFLDRADLQQVDRAWINGLLFGYRSGAIQDYIDRLD